MLLLLLFTTAESAVAAAVSSFAVVAAVAYGDVGLLVNDAGEQVAMGDTV